MEWAEKILGYFKRKEAGENLKAPEGVCPNCWGKQEYDGVVRDLVRDHQIDVNAGRENYAFIQDFVVNRFAPQLEELSGTVQ